MNFQLNLHFFNLEREATPTNALKLTGLEELCSDMIGLVHHWIVQLFLWIMVIGSYIGKLMLVESSWWLHYLRLPDDGAKTPKLVVDWYKAFIIVLAV